MEKIVAGTSALECAKPAIAAETELDQEASAIELRAQGMAVSNDTDYVCAAEMLKEIKATQKKVTEYWEPLRASAKDAYDRVLSRKKDMIDPLKSAEEILKSKMTAYSDEQERKRKAQEEALRKLAEAELEKKLAEAAAAEASGDSEAANSAMAEAEVMDDVSVGGSIGAPDVKVKGVSKSKTWKIVGVDASRVPVEINGMVIRPVDEKAILRIIKASKGTVRIPGVIYEETTTISARG